MTSRMSGHGLSVERNLTPDLKTFGKYLGGGITFGAFGGRADIMAAYDPRNVNSLPHSGTFNNNTLAMHAGYAGLTRIYTPSAADEFTQTGREFMNTLNEVTKGTKLLFTGYGSVMTAHFPDDGRREIQDAADVAEDVRLKDLFWFEMLEDGFWVARRGLIALILETPSDELARFVESVGKFVDTHRSFLTVAWP